MKAKWVKAAGLLAAGSLVFSAAYIDGKPGVKDTQEVMAESTDSQIHEVSAGCLPHWQNRWEIIQNRVRILHPVLLM